MSIMVHIDKSDTRFIGSGVDYYTMRLYFGRSTKF